ncbi:MAG: hypothetical protein ACFB4J_15205 [Elainellaceae cyanobacterium]
MTSDSLAQKDSQNSRESSPQEEGEAILCPHCRRTATNGIKCQGICVADSDY